MRLGTATHFEFQYYLVIISMCFTATGGMFGGGNYPTGNGPKLCSHPKATVRYVASICVPTSNGWRKDSEHSCWHLKDQCPEFNTAGCAWLPFIPSVGASGKGPIQFPTCRITYRARKTFTKKFDWIEVFYANQYGTNVRNDTNFDIVELHRKVNNKDAFPNAEQPDWPQNVPNPKGERGLDWKFINNTKVQVCTEKPLCVNFDKESEELCVSLASNVVKSMYHEGVDKKLLPKYDGLPAGTTSTEIVGTCSSALIDGLKKDVCEVVYTQFYKYTDPKDNSEITAKRIYLSVQVHSAKPAPGSHCHPFAMRYAYLPC